VKTTGRSDSFRFPPSHDLEHPLHTLIESARLIELRHAFVVSHPMKMTQFLMQVCQIGEGSASLTNCRRRAMEYLESFTTPFHRLNLIYEYRHCQVLSIISRLAVTFWRDFDGTELDAARRSESIASFLRSMELLRLIQEDPVLDRWCSIQKADFNYNMDVIKPASLIYPEGETRHLKEAGNSGVLLASSVARKANEKAQLLLKEAKDWGDLAIAAKKSGETAEEQRVHTE
jgi:hypothetical protein